MKKDPFNINFEEELNTYGNTAINNDSFITKSKLWYEINGVIGDFSDFDSLEPKIVRWILSLIFLDHYVASNKRATFNVYDENIDYNSVSVIVKGGVGNGRLADNHRVRVLARKDRYGSYVAKKITKMDGSSVHIERKCPWYVIWIATILIVTAIFYIIKVINNVINGIKQFHFGSLITGILIILISIIIIIGLLFSSRRRHRRKRRRFW